MCAGGIIGLGEAEEDRVGLLLQLATLPEHPESVPINRLVAVKGTPLQVWKQAFLHYTAQRMCIIQPGLRTPLKGFLLRVSTWHRRHITSPPLATWQRACAL